MIIAEKRHELLAFEDYHRMTIFADNIIPFVLRADGVLRYNRWLDERIQNEEVIGAGSAEEIEIRACAIHACEVLRSLICDELREITSGELDYCLWNRGQLLKQHSAVKRHRTRTIFY
jgi:hypothetical protein